MGEEAAPAFFVIQCCLVKIYVDSEPAKPVLSEGKAQNKLKRRIFYFVQKIAVIQSMDFCVCKQGF